MQLFERVLYESREHLVEEFLREKNLKKKLALAALIAISSLGISCNNIELESPQEIRMEIQADNDEVIEEVIEEYKFVYDQYKETIQKFKGNFSDHEIEIVIQAESSGDPNAESKSGRDSGLGLMQVSKPGLAHFNEKTGEGYTQDQLLDPETNIEVGCWILNDIERRIETDNLEHIYVAYNCGVSGYFKGYDEFYSKGIDRVTKKPYHGIIRLNSAIDEIEMLRST